MKGWVISDKKTITECDVPETNVGTKIKLTKTLISLQDVLRYSGESDKNIIPGCTGIGIISETATNLFGIEKGKHVYVKPTTVCNECYDCVKGNYNECQNLLTAGEDYDGFLRDFVSVNPENLFALPDNVTDFDALFINHVSLAIEVIDKLNIQKGEYVTVIGANNFGNILAQLLIYYSAVPIVLTLDEDDCATAKNSGIYYCLGADANWSKEVSNITGGRMTKKIVYITDCDIPAARAFSLAASNADIAFTGTSHKSSTISLSQALKKQLDICCISDGSSNIASAINVLSNKAINLSHLKIDSAKYSEVPQVFSDLSNQLEQKGKIHETVIDII